MVRVLSLSLLLLLIQVDILEICCNLKCKGSLWCRYELWTNQDNACPYAHMGMPCTWHAYAWNALLLIHSDRIDLWGPFSLLPGS